MKTELFSKADKCHIHLSGYINKVPTHFLGFVRPCEIVLRTLHSESMTVWCAIMGFGIIDLFFVEDMNGNAVIIPNTHMSPFPGDKMIFCGRNLFLIKTCTACTTKSNLNIGFSRRT